MDRLPALAGPLTAWFSKGARVLPWRSDPTPYRVWVSEVMLQQTRVAAVLPYFNRFMEALPTVSDLAACPEEKLMKLWEGLGYYSRARNLKKAAELVTAQYGGVLPSRPEELMKLPGIGPYTAAAIASIAYGVPAAAVDGNVLRVLARVAACEEDIAAEAVKRCFAEALHPLIPQDNAGVFTQALMELGAVVCVPNGPPLCGKCPLAGLCEANAAGTQTAFPVKSLKPARKIIGLTVFRIVCGERVALELRTEGLLRGLYGLPNAPGHLDEAEAETHLSGLGVRVAALTPLPPKKHVFTHVEWHMTGYEAQAEAAAPGFVWAAGDELAGRYALPAAFSKYIGA